MNYKICRFLIQTCTKVAFYPENTCTKVAFYLYFCRFSNRLSTALCWGFMRERAHVNKH